MPHCAAFGCSFQSKGNKGSNVSFNSFCSDKKRRNEWGKMLLDKDTSLKIHGCVLDAAFLMPLMHLID